MNALERMVREQESLARRIRAIETRIQQNDPSGWVAAGETWTYASSTTFTIDGDQTDRYQTGDYLKLKQGGAFLHYQVTEISYSSPNTTVTIVPVAGGSALANAAITDSYYSKAYSPQGISPEATAAVLDYKSATATDGTSTNSTEMVDLDSMSVSITVSQDALVLIIAHANMRTDTQGAWIRLVITDSDNNELSVRGNRQTAVANNSETVTTVAFQAISANKTYKLRWNVSAGTGTTGNRAIWAVAFTR